MILLENYGVLTVSGRQAETLLQGQLTVAVSSWPGENQDATASADGAKIAALCTHQGRMISIFWLLQDANQFYLIMPAELVEKTRETLAKFAVFYQVEILNQSEAFSVLGLPEGEHASADHKWLVEPRKAAPMPHSLALVASDSLSRLALKANHEQQWLAWEIAHSIPMLYEITSETLLPHNVGLPEIGGVDFDKGCYTGQEVIARMHYRGKLKVHVASAAAALELDAGAGSDVLQGTKKVGSVIRSAKWDGEQTMLLTLKDAAKESSEPLMTHGGELALKNSD